ncbi:polysaccharide lyase family 8 super-sandwich domain-containing protein [Vibrio sp. M60_M31a]
MKAKVELRLKKAWFSFADEVVALGAGINSTHYEPVNTSVNQVLLNGDVTVDGQVVQKGSRLLTDAKWVHHDNVGYVFPDSWKGTVSNQTQAGDVEIDPSNQQCGRGQQGRIYSVYDAWLTA